MSNKIPKPKRYFDLFKTQEEFFLTKLDEDFFIKNQSIYRDIWAQTRKSCLRLLLCHHDCPAKIRTLYTNHSKAQVRALAYFGYQHNFKGGASLEFIIQQEKNILKDKAYSVKAIYLDYYIYLKLIMIIKSKNPKDFHQENFYNTYDPQSRTFLDKASFLFKQIEENLDNLADEEVKDQLLKNTVLLLANNKNLSPSNFQSLSDFAMFLEQPTTGLISNSPLVRQIADKYYRQLYSKKTEEVPTK